MVLTGLLNSQCPSLLTENYMNPANITQGQKLYVVTVDLAMNNIHT
jgi:hypothetical protein